MAAYWITEYKDILDETKLAAYMQLARPALEEAGGTYLARGLPAQTYELGESTRTVLVEFDTVEAAISAHDTPAYHAALAALDGGAQRDIRIVAGE